MLSRTSRAVLPCRSLLQRGACLQRPDASPSPSPLACGTVSNPLSGSPLVQPAIPCRSLSTAVNGHAPKPNRFNKSRDDRALTNDDVVKFLVDRSRRPSSEIEVRLIMNEGHDQPSSVEVVSLAQAMDTTFDMGLDLIGIRLEDSPPILKADNYSKLIFKASKKVKTTPGSNKPLKEYKFRAGIADHDLQRKTNEMIEYLRKGHCCQVAITAGEHHILADPDVINTTVKRIKDGIADYGACGPVKIMGEEKTHASLYFQPGKKK